VRPKQVLKSTSRSPVMDAPVTDVAASKRKTRGALLAGPPREVPSF
jgi:hypothetical protein